MAEPILPLYAAFAASANALMAAQQTHEAHARTLIAAMPDGVQFSTVENSPPLIRRVGDQLVAESPPFIGHPYEPKS